MRHAKRELLRLFNATRRMAATRRPGDLFSRLASKIQSGAPIGLECAEALAQDGLSAKSIEMIKALRDGADDRLGELVGVPLLPIPPAQEEPPIIT